MFSSDLIVCEVMMSEMGFGEDFHERGTKLFEYGTPSFNNSA
jgi:hypothetical protein